MYTEPKPSHRRPLIGEVDCLEAFIGRRGMGKSTFECARAWQLASQFGGAYVIGHSLGSRMPAWLPKELGGHLLPIKYHTTIKKLEWGLRWNPNQWHILAPQTQTTSKRGPQETADDLLRFSLDLSLSIRKQAWRRANPWNIFPWNWWTPTVNYLGLECVPIIVIVDEGIAVDSAGPSRKDDNRWFLEYLYSLRHNHIALLWSLQDISARSWRIADQATAVHAFAIKHQWGINALQAAGATDEEMERIQTLNRYEHVTLSWDGATHNIERQG